MLSLLIKFFMHLLVQLFLRPPAGIGAGTAPPAVPAMRDWPGRKPRRPVSFPDPAQQPSPELPGLDDAVFSL
jgi:hypothetical protein